MQPLSEELPEESEPAMKFPAAALHLVISSRICCLPRSCCEELPVRGVPQPSIFSSQLVRVSSKSGNTYCQANMGAGVGGVCVCGGGGGAGLTIGVATITRIGSKSLLEDPLMFKEVVLFRLFPRQSSIAGQDGINLQITVW